MDPFVALNLDIGASISGGIGSILSLKFYGAIGWIGRITTAMGGWVCATFLTKPAIKFLKLIPPEDYMTGIGFLFGLFSMMIAAAVWKAIADTEWGRVISRRIGVGGAAAPSFGVDEK